MGRMSVVGLVVLGILGYGISLIDMGGVDATDEVAASLLLEFDAEDLAGYQSASGPREWELSRRLSARTPASAPSGGITLAISTARTGATSVTSSPSSAAPSRQRLPAGDSEWRSDQVYMGHFTVSDVAGGRFHHDQRYSRDGAGLAGATSDPRLHIWLEDLDMQALNDEATRLRLRASMEGAAIDFTLEHTKPPRLRGIEGYSQKGVEAHQASYYYSIPRLATQGTLTLGGERIEVQGESWMDHEFFTQYLTADVVGWDWFALMLDDGRELSLGWLRLKDGGQRYYGGDGAAAFLVAADGSTSQIAPQDFQVEVTGSWVSPHNGASYPSGWRVQLGGEQPLDFTLRPLLLDQELHESDIVYWEGAVEVAGDVAGYGYAELTGYHNPMGSDFFPTGGA